MAKTKKPDSYFDFVGRALRYADAVVSGEISASRQVKLAVQRQLDDLKRQKDPKFPYEFNEKSANRVCAFLSELPHVKGRSWKTKTIYLEDWQCFIWTTVFGWFGKLTEAEKREKIAAGEAPIGYRRFRKVYLELPRKNSKTTMCAGIGLYMLCADSEPGAEVYSAAVTRDQARITWDIAHQMVKRAIGIQTDLGVVPLARALAIPETNSTFKPLSRDADSMEGLNPHCAVIDELHVHKTREVFDVLNQGMGSRRQPLLLIITTAGDNQAGVCYEQHDYVVNILQGRHEDDRYFGVIYSIDVEDDWTAESSHRKANPNYGISVFPDDMKTQSQQAERSAESQNSFKTKRLNLWVSVGIAYFNMLRWRNKCINNKLSLDQFHGCLTYIGLDLASKTDIAAKMYLFPPGSNKDMPRNKYFLFGKYYLPESCIDKGNPNYDFYRGWNAKKLIKLTPGDVIDFEFIEQDLLEDHKNFRVVEVPFDPNQATELSTRMMKEGVKMKEVAPNVRHFSEPMKSLDALIISGMIESDGDPVLDWMLSNVFGEKNAKDEVYPRKIRPEKKIDGAVAGLMCLSRHFALAAKESVYESRGLRRI